jgi:FtsP/CotA-like multicopper oxidase with cupredoxin domain
MARRESVLFLFAVVLVLAAALPANAQSFRVQCPPTTITHPTAVPSTPGEPAYAGPTQYACTVTNGCGGSAGNVGYLKPTNGSANGAVKCQQISGGDGLATMADGTQTYMFSFGPLSGLADIANGQPGTEYPDVFNMVYPGPGVLQPGDPATTDGASDSGSYIAGALGAFTYNGAVGLMPDIPFNAPVFNASESGNTVTIVSNFVVTLNGGDQVTISGLGVGYDGTWTVTTVGVVNSFFAPNYAFQYTSTAAGLPTLALPTNAYAASPPQIDGHVDPRAIIDVGVMNGNIPAPLMAFDEDDEFFLTLSNVGMIMRPDLFEQHTVHFHGYPNASSVYDGVPDASVAINIGGSFTYYYLAPDAGTYFWHCHITPPEHLQMGMVGQLYVRPRQNRVPAGNSLYAALAQQNGVTTTGAAAAVVDLRTVCNPAVDILCSTTMPAGGSTFNTATRVATGSLCNGTTAAGHKSNYAYNDGDGSTCYDLEYALQIHGFDPNFHFVGMTFNPEAFADMKDKYFLLNGRSYPDTVVSGPMATQTTDGRMHYSQPLPSIIDIPAGGRALLRIADLDVSEYQTLASLGIRMKMVGFNAKLLRDQAGNNLEYYTNSITLGGGESLDVILDASDAGCGSTGCAATYYPSGSIFYLYTPNLDHLSNDAENFGGLMTEIHIQ